jgi:hypothetical protein
MSPLAAHLLDPVRMVKNAVFADRTEDRRIKFGIAAGMEMPINRRQNLRPELGIYELAIARHFKRLARGSLVGYDVGSAQGYYTLAMCKQGVQEVYAFEPDEDRAVQLTETLRRNQVAQRVTVLPQFLGARSDGRTATVDDLVASGRIPLPDIVKMDIEGAELDALIGMKRTVTSRRPGFVLEVHSERLEHDCTEFFRQAGYRQVSVVDQGPLMRRLLPEERPLDLNRWVVAR